MQGTSLLVGELLPKTVDRLTAGLRKTEYRSRLENLMMRKIKEHPDVLVVELFPRQKVAATRSLLLARRRVQSGFVIVDDDGFSFSLSDCATQSKFGAAGMWKLGG
jgi:uncharacterized protein YaiI (UPF0178 family)